MLCQLSGCCYDFTMLCSSNHRMMYPGSYMTRKTDSDLDSIESPFAQGPGLFRINQSKVLGESTEPMALGMSAWYLQFRQERQVWSWHVTEGSLNGCRTRGQKPFTELLMTMARPYTKTKERVLLGKIEWLLCYSSIVVTEQLVAHSSDVIYSWGKGELVKISKTECTKYWVIILVSPIVIYACFG